MDALRLLEAGEDVSVRFAAGEGVGGNEEVAGPLQRAELAGPGAAARSCDSEAGASCPNATGPSFAGSTRGECGRSSCVVPSEATCPSSRYPLAQPERLANLLSFAT